MSSRRQGIFWLFTVPAHEYVPYLPPGCVWIRGQLELGEGGFLHWQFLVAFAEKKTLQQVRSLFGPFHAELSRSEAAAEYVWKEETRVDGTQFEFGHRPFRRNSRPDWDAIWQNAQSGRVESVPSNIRVLHYRTLRSIAADYDRPLGIEKQVFVYWGVTGTGKSRRAWSEGGVDSYCKDPRSKFWCGYGGEGHVILDEFRGGIDASHLLRWLDRYPVRVEVKGSSRPLAATKIWITSNLNPADWYPDLDEETMSALRRRFTLVVHFNKPL